MLTDRAVVASCRSLRRITLAQANRDLTHRTGYRVALHEDFTNSSGLGLDFLPMEDSALQITRFMRSMKASFMSVVVAMSNKKQGQCCIMLYGQLQFQLAYKGGQKSNIYIYTLIWVSLNYVARNNSVTNVYLGNGMKTKER